MRQATTTGSAGQEGSAPRAPRETIVRLSVVLGRRYQMSWSSCAGPGHYRLEIGKVPEPLRDLESGKAAERTG